MVETKKLQQKNILVITAHADDHLACAGTLFKLKDKGYSTYELILTSSGEGRDFRKPRGNDDLAKLRDSEFSAASKFLGTKQVFKLNQEDLNLQYSKELMLKVVEVIRQVKPQIGIVHNPFDWHPDHVAAAKIGSEAFKIAGTGIRPELGENWKTSIVLQAEGMLPIAPDVLIDITDYAPKKRKLFKIYESQASPKLVAFEEGLGSIRGYQLRRPGSFIAEAFTIDETAPIILFDEDGRPPSAT